MIAKSNTLLIHKSAFMFFATLSMRSNEYLYTQSKPEKIKTLDDLYNIIPKMYTFTLNTCAPLTFLSFHHHLHHLCRVNVYKVVGHWIAIFGTGKYSNK